jgi:hypothetical protein
LGPVSGILNQQPTTHFSKGEKINKIKGERQSLPSAGIKI